MRESQPRQTLSGRRTFEKDEEVASCNSRSAKASAGSQGQLDQSKNIPRARWLSLSSSLFLRFLCLFLFTCVGLILPCCRPVPLPGGPGILVQIGLGLTSVGSHRQRRRCSSSRIAYFRVVLTHCITGPATAGRSEDTQRSYRKEVTGSHPASDSPDLEPRRHLLETSQVSIKLFKLWLPLSLNGRKCTHLTGIL